MLCVRYAGLQEQAVTARAVMVVRGDKYHQETSLEVHILVIFEVVQLGTDGFDEVEELLDECVCGEYILVKEGLAGLDEFIEEEYEDDG
jgi:hypothetical protein